MKQLRMEDRRGAFLRLAGGRRESDLAATIGEVLVRLPLRQSQVIVSRFYEGLSMQETAATLHCTRKAVECLSYRGFSEIGKILAA